MIHGVFVLCRPVIPHHDAGMHKTETQYQVAYLNHAIYQIEQEINNYLPTLGHVSGFPLLQGRSKRSRQMPTG